MFNLRDIENLMYELFLLPMRYIYTFLRLFTLTPNNAIFEYCRTLIRAKSVDQSNNETEALLSTDKTNALLSPHMFLFTSFLFSFIILYIVKFIFTDNYIGQMNTSILPSFILLNVLPLILLPAIFSVPTTTFIILFIFSILRLAFFTSDNTPIISFSQLSPLLKYNDNIGVYLILLLLILISVRNTPTYIYNKLYPDKMPKKPFSKYQIYEYCLYCFSYILASSTIIFVISFAVGFLFKDLEPISNLLPSTYTIASFVLVLSFIRFTHHLPNPSKSRYRKGLRISSNILLSFITTIALFFSMNIPLILMAGQGKPILQNSESGFHYLWKENNDAFIEYVKSFVIDEKTKTNVLSLMTSSLNRNDSLHNIDYDLMLARSYMSDAVYYQLLNADYKTNEKLKSDFVGYIELSFYNSYIYCPDDFTNARKYFDNIIKSIDYTLFDDNKMHVVKSDIDTAKYLYQSAANKTSELYEKEEKVKYVCMTRSMNRNKNVSFDVYGDGSIIDMYNTTFDALLKIKKFKIVINNNEKYDLKNVVLSIEGWGECYKWEKHPNSEFNYCVIDHKNKNILTNIEYYLQDKIIKEYKGRKIYEIPIMERNKPYEFEFEVNKNRPCKDDAAKDETEVYLLINGQKIRKIALGCLAQFK